MVNMESTEEESNAGVIQNRGKIECYAAAPPKMVQLVVTP
jgi:hypothetical protein